MRRNSLVILCVLVASSARAQSTAASAAAVRTAPDGRLVATMRAGAALKPGNAKGDWTAVTIEGFLHKSVVTSKKGILTIHASSGAALRASADPNGAIVAVIEDNVAIDNLVSTKGDWMRVRDGGWVQTRDIKTVVAKAPPLVGGAPLRASTSQGAPQRVAVIPPRAAPSPSPAQTARADAPATAGDFAASHPIILRAAPDGSPAGTAD
ncbi:MAG TPA: hypothetical protein VK511_08675, partial [Gemmatimonadaceae bacterium]|nr:hypothetical protein [Gemmatimonadaceae bacterium]